jgi:hypothetical protein
MLRAAVVGFRTFLVGLSVVLLLACARPARASAELRSVLAELAGNLAKVLEGRGEDSLAIGQFTGPAAIQTSAGPGIVQVLTEELKKKGISVKARAKVGVSGKYKIAELPAENPDDRRLGRKVLAVAIEVELQDAFGNPVGEFTFKRTIRGEATLMHTMGVSAALAPGGTERERDQELRKQYVDPKPALAGTLIRSRAGSPYAIEILVGGKVRRAETRDGLPFVGIKRGESYELRLINESAHEAAVQLRIDGLSMFAFSKLRQPAKLADGRANPRRGEPRYSVVIVPAKMKGKPGTAVIPGWHITNKDTDRFTVTAYARSAAAELKQTTGIGTITATFQAAWPKGAPAPADEPGKRRGGTGDATGRGPRIGVKYKEVERNLGVLRDAISVRYTRPRK